MTKDLKFSAWPTTILLKTNGKTSSPGVKYLIAADGTIIGKIGTDEELDSILAEIFAE